MYKNKVKVLHNKHQFKKHNINYRGQRFIFNKEILR
jgi:hypothetical protein